jgi:hypothetical protein
MGWGAGFGDSTTDLLHLFHGLTFPCLDSDNSASFMRLLCGSMIDDMSVQLWQAWHITSILERLLSLWLAMGSSLPFGSSVYCHASGQDPPRILFAPMCCLSPRHREWDSNTGNDTSPVLLHMVYMPTWFYLDSSLVSFWDWVLLCSPDWPQIHDAPTCDSQSGGITGLYYHTRLFLVLIMNFTCSVPSFFVTLMVAFLTQTVGSFYHFPFSCLAWNWAAVWESPSLPLHGPHKTWFFFLCYKDLHAFWFWPPPTPGSEVM